MCRVGSQAEHHHVLGDDVEGDNDSLTNNRGSAAATESLQLGVLHSASLQAVPHQLIGGHIADARNHLQGEFKFNSNRD